MVFRLTDVSGFVSGSSAVVSLVFCVKMKDAGALHSDGGGVCITVYIR